MPTARFHSVDDYIAAAAPAAQPLLQEIRRVARAAVPAATETISYQMPALRLTRVFFYYAAFRHHIGIYPPLTIDGPLTDGVPLRAQLAPYANDKGNLRFALDAPLPYALIAQLAAALAAQYAA